MHILFYLLFISSFIYNTFSLLITLPSWCTLCVLYCVCSVLWLQGRHFTNFHYYYYILEINILLVVVLYTSLPDLIFFPFLSKFHEKTLTDLLVDVKRISRMTPEAPERSDFNQWVQDCNISGLLPETDLNTQPLIPSPVYYQLSHTTCYSCIKSYKWHKH